VRAILALNDRLGRPRPNGNSHLPSGTWVQHDLTASKVLSGRRDRPARAGQAASRSRSASGTYLWPNSIACLPISLLAKASRFPQPKLPKVGPPAYASHNPHFLSHHTTHSTYFELEHYFCRFLGSGQTVCQLRMPGTVVINLRKREPAEPQRSLDLPHPAHFVVDSPFDQLYYSTHSHRSSEQKAGLASLKSAEGCEQERLFQRVRRTIDMKESSVADPQGRILADSAINAVCH
jgi:hypothetical protein